MEQYALSNEEITILKKYGEKFKKWLKTEDGKKENQDHQDHTNYFKLKLSSENLSKLKKSDLVELYKKLWVSSFWENKDWYITQLLEKNGFDNVKNELYQLLYGTESFEKRYDSFREKIKGFGISAISEILNMVYPENYCLWNDKSKTVLKFLNLRKNLSERLFKYNLLTGEEYSQCKDYLNAIKNELYSFDVKDFVDLDLFFWYIHKNIIPREWKKDSKLEYNKEEQYELQEEKKNDITDVENIILEYDKNKDVLGKRKITEKEAMKLRSEFISDFPPDKILNIEIDNYVEGKKLDTGEPNRKTFCYRLEFELDGFGNIGGVNAIKFGIYYSPKDKKYVYNEKKFHSAEEAYEKILKQINTLIESGKQFTQDNDWKKLSDAFERVDAIKSIVKSKILAVYFPDAIVSINSHNGIKQILKSLFHVPDEEIQEEFMINKEKLWEIKQNHPIMKNWSNFDYSDFVWYAWKKYFDNSNNLLSFEEKLDDINQLKTRFWIVRAGDTGQEEKVALDNDVITIHYGLHDFSSFKSKNEIINVFLKNSENENKDVDERLQASQYVEQIWTFLKEIKKNDIVLLPLKSRQSEWIAIGIVKEDYEYRNISETVKSTRRVEWLNKEIPKKEFDEITLRFLRLPRTVFRIKSSHAIQNIIDIMKKYQILPLYLEEELINKNRGLEIVAEENQDVESLQKQESIISIGELSKQTYLSLERLKEIEYLLTEKKQMIFYGPPGTSKTFVAKKFAEYFAQGMENIRIIQFHQSYSYEDFIEGIKPKLSETGEAIGFTLQSGLFKNLVKECIENPAKRFVLIIDEINRGNISKIFGELIYLLEYRNEKISLTYSPNEKFYIPSNLYIIGTMNSADRSIAFVDYALRRRFYFKEFYPDTSGDVLYSWYNDNNITEVDPHQIVTLLNEINKKISEQIGREYQIGYSYFMVKNLDKKKLKNIIDYAITPLIEQYFFGKKQKVEEIKQIWSTIFNINTSDFQTSSTI